MPSDTAEPTPLQQLFSLSAEEMTDQRLSEIAIKLRNQRAHFNLEDAKPKEAKTKAAPKGKKVDASGLSLDAILGM